MTMEELLKDAALQAELEREVEAKTQDGTPLAEAKAQVLRARGIEFDEDAMKAEAVTRMKLSDEALDNIAGGLSVEDCCFSGDYMCVTAAACYTALLHKSGASSEKSSCWSDYSCVFVNHRSSYDKS